MRASLVFLLFCIIISGQICIGQILYEGIYERTAIDSLVEIVGRKKMINVENERLFGQYDSLIADRIVTEIMQPKIFEIMSRPANIYVLADTAIMYHKAMTITRNEIDTSQSGNIKGTITVRNTGTSGLMINYKTGLYIELFRDGIKENCFQFKDANIEVYNTQTVEVINGWECTIWKVKGEGDEIFFWISKEVPKCLNLGFDLFDGGVVQIANHYRAKRHTLKSFQPVKKEHPFPKYNCNNLVQKDYTLFDHLTKPLP